MKNVFTIIAMLIVALASAPTKAEEQRDPGGNGGVHIVPVPLKDGSGKGSEGHELRPGQFPRGTKFFDEPKGWIDGDPCWRYTKSDEHKVWEFVCD
jgi:hypothetical protein